jgi:F-type H+-transporting ATPase subunit delta
MAHDEKVVERYAEALIQLASERSLVKEWQLSMRGALLAIENHRFLKKALYSLQIPKEVKKAILSKVFSGTLALPLLNFLYLLVDKGRERFLKSMVIKYDEKVRELEGTLAATVTLAAVPADDTLEALEKALSRYEGKPVKVDYTVDPAIIGGAVVKLDGRLLDWSIAAHLASLKELMIGALVV